MNYLCRVWRSVLVAGLAAIAGVSLAVPAPVAASDAAQKTFQEAAYGGRFNDGAGQLAAMARADASDVEAVFGLGALQFFGAIASLQEGLYKHTTSITAQGRGGRWITGLMPFGRATGGVMLVPPNPNATPMTYRKLRQLLAEFATALEIAENTLARVGDRPVKLVIRPFEIAIDLDHDGAIQPNERILANLLNGRQRRMRDNIVDTELAFDTADASWLRGYSHVLMASVNFMLAFDFEKSYAVAAHNIYGDSATAFGREIARQAGLGRPLEEIQADLDDLQVRIQEARREKSNAKDIRNLRNHLKTLPDTPENQEQRKLLGDALQNMIDTQKNHRETMQVLYAEQRRLRSERDGGTAGWLYDAVAFVHTLSWDVVEPRRLSAARQHLIRVMELNRNTWALARRETDDDREWLPNASQTPPFGARPVSDAVIDSWLATTAMAEAVLNGEKLLPHPRFKKGVNLRKIFESAKRLDFVLLATGHDLVQYLEEGEVMDEKAWSAITQPMGRHVGQYAIWFN